jgi:eukaryotic-like serine/threonine-protein kinase
VLRPSRTLTKLSMGYESRPVEGDQTLHDYSGTCQPIPSPRTHLARRASPPRVTFDPRIFVDKRKVCADSSLRTRRSSHCEREGGVSYRKQRPCRVRPHQTEHVACSNPLGLLRFDVRWMSLASSHPYRVVGRYRLHAELASGGMATVHLGCLLGAAGFSKLVAVKCLHEQFAVEPSFVSMFLDEARLASSIHHPNVVASLDVVAEEGQLLVVMEYVHGETLAGLLRAGRQAGEVAPAPVAARVICDALEGLHAAHTASLAGSSLDIVHRDVSPQNIMVGTDGSARVLDFGIAQAALRSHVTAVGTVKGKIAYMSPEQAQGLGVDARTDVFAAGVVLWEALTGRRLFFAPDSRDAMDLLLTLPVPKPSSIISALPHALDAVVLKALERSRELRYASAHEFAEALRGAVSEASRKEVAEWVGRLAKEGLAKRLELLQALEATAIQNSGETSRNPPAPSSPRAAPSSPRAAPLPMSGEQTQAQVTVTTSVLPMPQRQQAWHRKASSWVAAVGVAIALGAVGLLMRASAASEAAVAAASQAPAAYTRAAPDTPAPVSPLASASALPLAASALPLASAPALPLASAPASRLVAAEELPLMPARAPKPITKKQPQREAAPTNAPKKSCSPPYRIDANGVRRVKPECL